MKKLLSLFSIALLAIVILFISTSSKSIYFKDEHKNVSDFVNNYISTFEHYTTSSDESIKDDLYLSLLSMFAQPTKFHCNDLPEDCFDDSTIPTIQDYFMKFREKKYVNNFQVEFSQPEWQDKCLYEKVLDDDINHKFEIVKISKVFTYNGQKYSKKNIIVIDVSKSNEPKIDRILLPEEVENKMVELCPKKAYDDAVYSPAEDSAKTNLAYSYVTKGNESKRSGDMVSAITFYERAINLNSSDEVAQRNLRECKQNISASTFIEKGDSYARAGKIGNAKRAYQQAMEYSPTYEEQTYIVEKVNLCNEILTENVCNSILQTADALYVSGNFVKSKYYYETYGQSTLSRPSYLQNRIETIKTYEKNTKLRDHQEIENGKRLCRDGNVNNKTEGSKILLKHLHNGTLDGESYYVLGVTVDNLVGKGVDINNIGISKRDEPNLLWYCSKKSSELGHSAGTQMFNDLSTRNRQSYYSNKSFRNNKPERRLEPRNDSKEFGTEMKTLPKNNSKPYFESEHLNPSVKTNPSSEPVRHVAKNLPQNPSSEQSVNPKINSYKYREQDISPPPEWQPKRSSRSAGNNRSTSPSSYPQDNTPQHYQPTAPERHTPNRSERPSRNNTIPTPSSYPSNNSPRNYQQSVPTKAPSSSSSHSNPTPTQEKNNQVQYNKTERTSNRSEYQQKRKG